MRRVREILRLHHEHGLGCKRIARSCNVGKNTVLRCLQRARAAGLGWPLPEGLDDAKLEAMLYAKPTPRGFYPIAADTSLGHHKTEENCRLRKRAKTDDRRHRPGR